MSTIIPHTPAPWKASKGDEDEPERWLILADAPLAFHIATIENGQPGDTMDTEGATAAVMAAAPEMLAALEGWLAKIDGPWKANPALILAESDKAILVMRQAVQKARTIPQS